MTTLTFESMNYSPRRAAVRRNTRPVRALAPEQQVLPAALRQERTAGGGRNKAGLAALFALTVLAHAAVILALQHKGDIEAAPPVAPPMALEFAPPPPPPPPPEQPKPQPKIARAAPAPRVAPSVPVVNQAPVEDSTPSANTVQVATPAPPAPVSAPPAPPAPEPVTEPRGFAGYKNNPAPDYPAQAQDRGMQGQVILKVHVLASGHADNVTVAKSSGFRILDDAAVKAVLAWSFDPAKRGQTPIDGWVKVPLNFKLS